MSGEIQVNGPHFSFDARGGSGLLSDLNPALVAERKAAMLRAHKRAVQDATAQWRAPPVPFVPIDTPGAARSPSPAAQVIADAEQCAIKTRCLSGLDGAEGFLQPAHLRGELAELRGLVKAEMVELQC